MAILYWGCTYETNLERVIKIITNSKFDVRAASIFQRNRLLNINNIFNLQVGIFMFYFYNRVLPEQFQCLFQNKLRVHSYQTTVDKNNITEYLTSEQIKENLPLFIKV